MGRGECISFHLDIANRERCTIPESVKCCTIVDELLNGMEKPCKVLLVMVIKQHRRKLGK
jgi:hypothetical protein